MINREDAIDNLTYALSEYCTENLNDFNEDIEFAINDMKAMYKIRKYMLKDEKFETLIYKILENN